MPRKTSEELLEKGAHADAIRAILAAASGKENKRYILEIVEHTDSKHQQTQAVAPIGPSPRAGTGGYIRYR